MEMPGWAQGAVGELADAARRDKLTQFGIYKEDHASAIRKKFIRLINRLIMDANKPLPKAISENSISFSFYSHPAGFKATYGTQGYVKFLELAKDYVKLYTDSMFL